MRDDWRLLSKVAVLLVGSLIAIASQAGNIRGAWDPIIGGSYQSTGFRGEVTFFVPDACLASDGYKINNGTCGGDMQLLDARVWLYDTSGDLDGMPLVFSFIDPVGQLYGIDVAFNSSSNKFEVVGLDTGYLGPVNSGYLPPPALPPNAPEYFYLFFASGSGAGAWEGLDGGAYLQECEWVVNDGEYCSPGFRSARGLVTYYTPEPGTLSLLLGALGFGWFVRRRTTVS